MAKKQPARKKSARSRPNAKRSTRSSPSSGSEFVPFQPGVKPNMTLSAWLANRPNAPISTIERESAGWTVNVD